MIISKSIQRRVLIQMGKVIDFPIRDLSIEGETSVEDIIKAIRNEYSETEVEVIKQELEVEDDETTN